MGAAEQLTEGIEDKTSCAYGPFHDMLINTVLPDLDFQELALKVSHENIRGKAVELVAFVGKITNSNSFELNRKIHRIFETRNYHLIVDLSQLEYVNSSGVAIIFSLYQRIRENDGRMLIGGLHPFLKNVFNMMDIPPQLEVYETLEEAKQKF